MLSKIYKSALFKIINNFRVLLALNKINNKTIYSNCDLTLVIFSKDRPFQLRSLIASVKENFSGLSKIIVIHTASSVSMSNRYKKLASSFKNGIIKFIEEKDDFKKNLNQVLFQVKTTHIIFSVDDILLFDRVILEDLEYVIKKNNIFSLRLGQNINFSYMSSANQTTPKKFKRHKGDIISWKISDGKYDFSYPFSLDMHIFSSKLIKTISNYLFFNSVNSYESALNIITKYVSNWEIYSFNNSKCVNLPFNKIQNENDNNSAGFDYKELNFDFDNNKIYDFKSIKINHINSPHQILDVSKVKLKKNMYT